MRDSAHRPNLAGERVGLQAVWLTKAQLIRKHGFDRHVDLLALELQ
jgi:hypothetical protein